jgi:hypothetical protein
VKNNKSWFMIFISMYSFVNSSFALLAQVSSAFKKMLSLIQFPLSQCKLLLTGLCCRFLILGENGPLITMPIIGQVRIHENLPVTIIWCVTSMALLIQHHSKELKIIFANVKLLIMNFIERVLNLLIVSCGKLLVGFYYGSLIPAGQV